MSTKPPRNRWIDEERALFRNEIKKWRILLGRPNDFPPKSDKKHLKPIADKMNGSGKVTRMGSVATAPDHPSSGQEAHSSYPKSIIQPPRSSSPVSKSRSNTPVDGRRPDRTTGHRGSPDAIPHRRSTPQAGNASTRKMPSLKDLTNPEISETQTIPKDTTRRTHNERESSSSDDKSKKRRRTKDSKLVSFKVSMQRMEVYNSLMTSIGVALSFV